MIRIRFVLIALAGVALLLAPLPLQAQTARPGTGQSRPVAARPIPDGAIQAIKITGNQRIEDSTIRSYILLQVGDAFDADRADRSLKALYGTGLFQDVKLDRDGGALLIRVQENPLVNRIAFEGNRKLTDAILAPEMKLRSRGVFTTAAAQQDRQRILDLYAAKGRFAARVEPKLIRLEDNRVDVVYEVADGDVTLISRMAIVGNSHFSESKLLEVVNTRESAWWRFLSSSDFYDPDRIAFDKELLRRYYLKNGYVDFQVVDATAELTADRSAFFVTYTLYEGDRYRIGKVSANVTLRNLSNEDVQKNITIDVNDWYNGDTIERATEVLDKAIRARGFTFVEVKPRISRDPIKKTVDLVFDVNEGSRIFVERIDIIGNMRTQDKVIRRQILIAEGDAFDVAKVRRSRQRLSDLGYFEQGTGVTMTPSRGSTQDRTIITTEVQEKATGEFSIAGGYSSDIGALIDIGLKERNLVGTGITAGVNGIIAQRRSSITLSVTDPYFLDRNLTSGVDLFFINSNNLDLMSYMERRSGFAYKFGYALNEHLSQLWTYSLINREVYHVNSNANILVQDMAGKSLISQIGSMVAIDYRDSRLTPRSGFIVSGGLDFAGLGGDAHFARGKIDSAAYVPLDRYSGNTDWGMAFQAGIGQLFNLHKQELMIDRFFLGGENLRGFASAGAGPHSVPVTTSVGGRLIWTATAELRFPLPLPGDLGMTGRAFVDAGALSQANFISGTCRSGPCPTIIDDAQPRVGAGVGVSWQTPFGIIKLDLAPFVVKYRYDQTQMFRFGFGTRF